MPLTYVTEYHNLMHFNEFTEYLDAHMITRHNFGEFKMSSKEELVTIITMCSELHLPPSEVNTCKQQNIMGEEEVINAKHLKKSIKLPSWALFIYCISILNNYT